MPPSTVRSDILKGAVWLTSFKLVERAIGVTSTLILVRFLVPEDFGLVAMAMSIIVAVELLTSFGFDVVLIQNQKATTAHYQTSWTFKVCFGVVSALTVAALAHPISWFYQDGRLVFIMYVIAANHVIGSLENIAIVDFRKNMQFHKEVGYQLAIKLSGFVVAVPMAVLTQSYWALVAGMLARNVAKLVISFAVRPMRPALTFSKAREIFGFSAWLMVNNALFTAISRAHDFIVGRVSGAKGLGTFSISLEISNMISTELIAPINRAAFPGYARITADKEQFRNTYLDITACIMLLSVPAALGVSATAELLVPVLLGSNWMHSIPIIKVLALYGAVYSLSTNSIYVFHALAQPRLVTRLAIAQAVVLIPAMYVATTEFGLIGAAYAMLGTSVVVAVPLMWILVCKVLNMRLAKILSNLWRPLFGSCLMYLGVRWMVALPAVEALADLLALILVSFAGATIYVTFTMVAWWAVGKPYGAETILLPYARGCMGRIRDVRGKGTHRANQ